MAAVTPPSADADGVAAIKPASGSDARVPRRRFNSMFMRLFFVMAAIMLAVHILGVTVIENVFPRPGSERYMERMRRAASEAQAAGLPRPAAPPPNLLDRMLGRAGGPPPSGNNGDCPPRPDGVRPPPPGMFAPPRGQQGPPQGFHIRGIWPQIGRAHV